MPLLAASRTTGCPQLADMDRGLRERLQYAYEEGNCGGHTPEALLALWQGPECPLCHERQHGCVLFQETTAEKTPL